MNREQIWKVAGVALLFCGVANAQKATFTTFDVPAAVNGTFPSGINPAGAITGNYTDASFGSHGFLRARDGTFTTFDVPGAGTSFGHGTFPSGINPAGAITGLYVDASFGSHGFLRARDGTFTTFDVPGAVNGTYPVGINPSGTTTGAWFDANFVIHSFVRASDGTFATFDPGLFPELSGVINPAGEVTGIGGVSFNRGIVRDPDGAVTEFDAPSVCTTNIGTQALGINPAGLVVGTYEDAGCVNFHGFLRAPDGTFTTIDFPGAADTEADAINPAGAISGIAFTSSGLLGFLRSPSGTFTTYSAPAVPGNGPNDKALNPAGEITGFYQGSNGFHGYLWTPQGR